MDLLQVAQPEQFDVILPEAAIGDRRGYRGEVQRFAGQIEFEEQVCVILEIRPGDEN